MNMENLSKTEEPTIRYSNKIEQEFDYEMFRKLSYKAMLKHKRMHNSPVVIMRDGKIVELNPHEMPDKLD